MPLCLASKPNHALILVELQGGTYRHRVEDASHCRSGEKLLPTGATTRIKTLTSAGCASLWHLGWRPQHQNRQRAHRGQDSRQLSHTLHVKRDLPDRRALTLRADFKCLGGLPQVHLEEESRQVRRTKHFQQKGHLRLIYCICL